MIPEEIFWQVLSRSNTVNSLRSYDHGPQHWSRVLHNGLALAKQVTDADIEVVRFFSLFHDTMRNSERGDPGHGIRGLWLAETSGVKALLTPAQWILFSEAVIFHDKGDISNDPTIGVCWDADRLDLPRVGITPDPKFFSTKLGRKLAIKAE